MGADMGVAGIVLAAGAGRRMGRPKALVHTGGRSWLVRSVALLRQAGCTPVVVCLGESADEARILLPPSTRTVTVDRWSEGVGVSLAAGLNALLEDTPATTTAAMITLVDLPDLRLAAAQRVLSTEWDQHAVRRATYHGRPGHPVLLGRAHWAPLVAELHGDTGAGGYLRAHGAVPVDCTDLGGGDDVDALAPGRTTSSE